MREEWAFGKTSIVRGDSEGGSGALGFDAVATMSRRIFYEGRDKAKGREEK